MPFWLLSYMTEQKGQTRLMASAPASSKPEIRLFNAIGTAAKWCTRFILDTSTLNPLYSSQLKARMLARFLGASSADVWGIIEVWGWILSANRRART
jgi:hypothetical protein